MSSHVDGSSSEVSRDYAAAYSAHYSERDLGVALARYQKLVASYPGAREAGYSRTQILNIVGAVVPVGDLLSAQVTLALEYLGNASVPEGPKRPGAIGSERSE